MSKFLSTIPATEIAANIRLLFFEMKMTSLRLSHRPAMHAGFTSPAFVCVRAFGGLPSRVPDAGIRELTQTTSDYRPINWKGNGMT
jgi:hypothetical protein